MNNKNGIQILKVNKPKPKSLTPPKNKFAISIPNNNREDSSCVSSFTTTLWEIQKERCWYCGKYVRLIDTTIDHKIPQSIGGPDTFNNCVMSCYKCNHTKGNKHINSFRSKWTPKKGTYHRSIVGVYLFYGESEHAKFQCNLNTLSGGNKTIFQPVNKVVIQKVLPLF